MTFDNEEAHPGHNTELESNHWIVTISQDSLLAWNSIMAQINSNQGGIPHSRIWCIWISAVRGNRLMRRSSYQAIHYLQEWFWLIENYCRIYCFSSKKKNFEKPSNQEELSREHEQIKQTTSENKRLNQACALLILPPPLRYICGWNNIRLKEAAREIKGPHHNDDLYRSATLGTQRRSGICHVEAEPNSWSATHSDELALFNKFV